MLLRLSQQVLKRSNPFQRRFSSPAEPKSRHASFYSETLPAMMPVFLLGSAIYLGLRLTQMQLIHEKFVEGAEGRIHALESEIASLEETRSQTQLHPAAGGSPVQAQSSPKRSRWALW